MDTYETWRDYWGVIYFACVLGIQIKVSWVWFNSTLEFPIKGSKFQGPDTLSSSNCAYTVTFLGDGNSGLCSNFQDLPVLHVSWKMGPFLPPCLFPCTSLSSKYFLIIISTYFSLFQLILSHRTLLNQPKSTTNGSAEQAEYHLVATYSHHHEIKCIGTRSTVDLFAMLVL